jgi:hypothetical protein
LQPYAKPHNAGEDEAGRYRQQQLLQHLGYQVGYHPVKTIVPLPVQHTACFSGDLRVRREHAENVHEEPDLLIPQISLLACAVQMQEHNHVSYSKLGHSHCVGYEVTRKALIPTCLFPSKEG